MRAALAASALALLLGSSALAGPKPPASAVFEPEIGYTYGSGNYTDLRLANRAGTAAILVHRTAFGALGSFDLSDEGTKRIAYTDGGKLYTRFWQPGSTVSVTGPTPIYEGPKYVEMADFSPEGGRLAFTVLSAAGDEIYVSNLLAPPESVLTGYKVLKVRWDPDPDSQVLYFTGYPSGPTTTPLGLYKLTIGTPPLRLFPTPGGLVDFDLSRAPVASVDARIVAHIQGAIDLWRTDGSFHSNLASGSLAHFNCRNDAIIHRAAATRRPPTRITYLSGAFETWSTDSNIHHTDWMRRVPCPLP